MRNRPLSVDSAGRRFVALTAMRWLPVGIAAPVVVLLASSRGLGPSEIGMVFVVHSTVALLLELPTGGLADALGRRPVLVLSSMLHVAGFLTLAVASDLLVFGAAFALVGAARALDSGPLESWYVDAVGVASPAADVTPGLSRAAAASGAGLAFGCVVGGAAPAVLTSFEGEAVMAAPFLVAAVLQALYLVAIVVLVVPVGPHSSGAPVAAMRNALREVPGIVRDTGRLAGRDPVLRRLVALSFLAGVVLSTLELVGPLHFARLTGSTTEGSAVFGVVMAASFTCSALGASLATRARRLARGSTAWASAALFCACAVAVSAVAASTLVVAAGLGYAAFYLVNAVGWPLRQQLMHSRVGSGRRATTVSASSFALMAGGIGGSLLMPALAEATSLTAAFWACLVPLVASAWLSLGLGRGGTPAGAPAGARSGAPVGAPHDANGRPAELAAD